MQQLFEARLDLARTALDQSQPKAFDLVIVLIKADLDRLSEETISVREKWREKRNVSRVEVLQRFDPAIELTLRKQMAPLMQWADIRGEIAAYRFDLLIAELQIALDRLVGTDLPALEETFVTSGLDIFSYEGQRLGIPFWGSSSGLFYRTDLLEEYGFGPPQTYDELVEIIETEASFDAEGLRLRLRAEVPGAVLDEVMFTVELTEAPGPAGCRVWRLEPSMRSMATQWRRLDDVVPAAETTFSSIITEPMSLAP